MLAILVLSALYDFDVFFVVKRDSWLILRFIFARNGEYFLIFSRDELYEQELSPQKSADENNKFGKSDSDENTDASSLPLKKLEKNQRIKDMEGKGVIIIKAVIGNRKFAISSASYCHRYRGPSHSLHGCHTSMCQLLVFSALLCVARAVDFNETIPNGLLTRECIAVYFRTYVLRLVPPRQYQYYHEVLAGNLDDSTSEEIGFRIVGGKKINIQDAPYQVLYGKFCGGALLAPSWVITAAHCKQFNEYVYASSTFRSDAVPYRICAHFVHPYWNHSGLHSHDFDYQLLLLQTPIPINSLARPIAIGTIYDIKPGNLIAVSGWGHLGYKTSHMQDVLHRVRVPIISSEECKQLPDAGYQTITPRMFCAGYLNGTKDSCQGDSGGPAVYNGKLVGVVSYGVGCAAPQRPGVYTNVPMMRMWIRYVTSLPL